MSFDQIVIHFASPTVCGIKPANTAAAGKPIPMWIMQKPVSAGSERAVVCA